MFLSGFVFNLSEIIAKSPAKRDRLIIIPLIVCGFFILIDFILTPLFFWRFKDYAVLHYNIYFGISSLGPWLTLLLIPLSGLLVAAVNCFLSLYFYLRDKLLSYFLAIAGLAYNLMAFLALLLIIYINL
jgi:hypothetical protein